MNLCRHIRLRSMTCVVFVLAPGLTAAWAAGDYAIDWSTIDSGGAGPSNAGSGGNYTLSGTIGQPDARNHPEPMSGGSYKLTGGFWVIRECPAIPGDFDGDCDVDEADFAVLAGCASGAGGSHDGSDLCYAADFDYDKDVDMDDFAVFQRCWTGEDGPFNPDCAH